MPDPLQRLVELWDRSLDGGLDRAADAELKSLLSDAPLVERFSQLQASLTPAEGLDHGPTPALDAAVMKGYRRFLSRGKALWIAAASLATLGLGLAWAWHAPSLPETPVQPMDAQHSALALKTEAVAKPNAIKALGLPPGYGSRETRFIQAVGSTSTLTWTGEEGRLVHVLVLDSEGRTVRKLWRGRASAQAQQSQWDGMDAKGQAATPGAYRLVAYSQGHEISSATVELTLKP